MKKAFATTAAIFALTASRLMAQEAPADLQASKFHLDIQKPRTVTALTVNEGDTIFIKANGKYTCGPYGGPLEGGGITPCGYSDPELQDKNKYMIEDQDEHGALVLLIANGEEMIAGSGFCKMKNATFSEDWRYVVAHQAGEVVLDINDKDANNNTGYLNADVFVGRGSLKLTAE